MISYSKRTETKQKDRRKQEVLYKYGMRLRPAMPGAQPRGFVKFDESDSRYHNVIYYGDQLSEETMKAYELDYLGEEADEQATPCNSKGQTSTH